eukprot:scpid99796/ scgid5751/ 
MILWSTDRQSLYIDDTLVHCRCCQVVSWPLGFNNHLFSVITCFCPNLYNCVMYSLDVNCVHCVQCSAVQCSAMLCSAVQCSAVQYSTVHYSTVQRSTVQY